MTTDPHQHTAAFMRAFNSGDLAAIEATLHPDAVFIRQPGDPVTGDDRRKAISDFLAIGVPMRIQDRHVYVAGDTALIIADWVVSGEGAYGSVQLKGTSTDVLRQDADGRWRSIIDNPHGTAPADD